MRTTLITYTIINVCIIFFCLADAGAQNRITGYEYWYNNSHSNRTEVSVTPAENQIVSEELNVSDLPDGINVLYMRFRDEEGLWSSIMQSMFYKIRRHEEAENTLSTYEYWFNDNYADRTLLPADGTSQHLITGSIDVSHLPEGVNVLNIRFRDSEGVVSAVLSEMFLRAPLGIMTNNMISAYSYWFNSNSEAAITVLLETPVPQYALNAAINMQHMQEGEHLIHFRFRDSEGLWSVVLTDTVYKSAMPVDVSVTITDGTLTANAEGATYQWLDCDNNHAPIAGETNRTFSPGSSGNYAVLVEQNGSRDTSACYFVTTVGIIDNSFGNDIRLFPNPTSGHFTIDMGESVSTLFVSVRDMTGRLISSTLFTGKRLIDYHISEPPGIYLVTLTDSDNRSVTIRVIRK